MQSMKTMLSRSRLAFPALLLLTALAPAQELDKAMTALKSGDWKSAAEIAGKVEASSADYARAQYVCGEAHLIMNDAVLAEASFRHVLEKNPDATPASIGLGRALTAEAKYPEAEELLVKALQADPKDALAQLALGQTHLAMKKTAEAKAEIGAAYQLDAKNPIVVRGWCEWLFAENDNVKASKAAADLAKSQPKHPMGPFLQGLAFERDGKDGKAIEAYEEALKRDPNFLDAHKNLAIVCHTRNPMYQDAGRSEKSLQHYERYFTLGGKDAELEQAYRQFKQFYEQMTDPKKK
ncbi:MAG TPA: tetratricopeptide repeat protein [Planctomycetota bacterium]|nr:tetratricopeptide repeat protein [Planctomycetota bacterium]